MKPLHPWRGDGEYSPSFGENHAVGFAQRMTERIARAQREREQCERPEAEATVTPIARSKARK